MPSSNWVAASSLLKRCAIQKFLILYVHQNKTHTTMKFNVSFEIKGTASCIVEAETKEEAKRIAIEDGLLGENDYFWWIDKDSKVAASTTDMNHTYDMLDLSELPSDEWEYVD